MRGMKICLPSLAIAMISLFLHAAWCAQEDTPGGHATAEAEPSLQVMRARRLIDMAVQNREREHLGEIEDVVIDTADGRIAYVAMDAGLLGPILAVPWEALDVAQDKSTVTLNVAKETLQKAPTFRRANWPETVDPDWLAGVYNYYGYPPYPGLTEITVQHKRVTRVTTLLGLNVRNRQRENLGEIEDFMIDTRGGHIAYVLLGTGGILGVGERVRAVPWAAMRVEPIERVVVLGIDKEKLHKAPPLEAGAWEETASRKWLAGVYAYYGARPYWEKGD